MQGYDGYSIEGIDLYECAFCEHLWWRFHLPVMLWHYLEMVLNHKVWILPQLNEWRGPLIWYVLRIPPCVTYVEHIYIYIYIYI